MYFALGVIVGILLAILMLVALMYLRPRIEQRIHQVQSALRPKGSIIEPEAEELEQWVDSLKI